MTCQIEEQDALDTAIGANSQQMDVPFFKLGSKVAILVCGPSRPVADVIHR